MSKLLGNRVAVSPIVTVEPRRRKFHKPITLTIPVPTAANKGMINQYSGDAPTLRLLCSITGTRYYILPPHHHRYLLYRWCRVNVTCILYRYLSIICGKGCDQNHKKSDYSTDNLIFVINHKLLALNIRFNKLSRNDVLWNSLPYK